MRCFWLTFGVLVVLAGLGECRRKKIPGWHIRMAQRQGPNTCAVEEVPETSKKYYTECKYWMHRKICGRKTIIRYECCEGYERVNGEHGCVGVKALKDVVETASDLGATIFAQYLEEAGLANQLRKAGAFTVFAPTNTAFETLTRDQREQLARSYNNPKSPILLYHVANKRVHSKDFHTDMMVDTMFPGRQIRVNKYSNNMMTVNCAPVMRKDQEATNGVVHLIDNVLEPQAPRSVADTISNDGRFQELARFIQDTGLSSQLRDAGSFTVLVPSDEEFQKISSTKRQRLRTDPEARKAITSNHIIPHTVCMSAVVDEHKLTTLDGKKLTFLCNESGIYVDGSRLTGESIIGSNGVVLMISDVIVPDRAKFFTEMAENYEVQTFFDLVRRTGLESMMMSGQNEFTIFAPSDEAFKELSQEEQERLRRDVQSTRDLLRFHIAHGKYTQDQMTDNQKIPTLDGRNSLRLRVYRKGFGVETAMFKDSDVDCMNGVMHVIDKVLTPPTNDMIDLLQSDGNFSIMVEALQKMKNVDPYILNSTEWQGGSMTLFAPSDEAFRKLGRSTLRRVMSNTTYLSKILKNHIVENMISSGSFKTKLHYNVRTKENVLEVHKRSHGIHVGNAMVMKPDIVTREGIVHMVDHVILPSDMEEHEAYYHG